MEQLREIETGEKYFLLSQSLMYAIQTKRILVFRKATGAEECGFPTNNDYPYDQDELLKLEFLHPEEEEEKDTTMTVIILEELKKADMKKIIRNLETE